MSHHRPITAVNTVTANSLYRHALESIFAFSSLGGLAVAMSVCRGWSSAVGTMRPIGARAPVFDTHSFVALVCASRLARHIGAITGKNQPPFLCTTSNLQLFSARMPNLHHLTLHMWPQESTITLPQKLVSLKASVAGNVSEGQINMFILCASRLPLLARLIIKFNHPLDPWVSFAALHTSPLLVELGIRLNGKKILSEKQVDELRAMPHITSLGIDLTPPLMRRLLRLPHSLHWQSLGERPLPQSLFALLPALPSITSVSVALGGNDDVSKLRQLPNLRDLCLDLSMQSPWTKQLEVLQQSCTRLTSLNLLRGQFNANDLCVLLPCITDLRVLCLWRIETIDSLRFLSRGPIVHTLTYLRLGHLGNSQMHSSEMLHVNELRELRRLDLHHLFVEPLDPLTRLFYSPPPSRLLPKLTLFEYS